MTVPEVNAVWLCIVVKGACDYSDLKENSTTTPIAIVFYSPTSGSLPTHQSYRGL